MVEFSSAPDHAPPDSWITACGLARDRPLATLNVKDYEDFREHKGLALLT